jgi:hypothetical protein
MILYLKNNKNYIILDQNKLKFLESDHTLIWPDQLCHGLTNQVTRVLLDQPPK